MTVTTAETTNERESCFMERTPAVGTESGLHGGNPRQPHRHSRSDSERCMDAANRGSSPEICCSISCKTRRSRSLNMTTSRFRRTHSSLGCAPTHWARRRRPAGSGRLQTRAPSAARLRAATVQSSWARMFIHPGSTRTTSMYCADGRPVAQEARPRRFTTRSPWRATQARWKRNRSTRSGSPSAPMAHWLRPSRVSLSAPFALQVDPALTAGAAPAARAQDKPPVSPVVHGATSGVRGCGKGTNTIVLLLISVRMEQNVIRGQEPDEQAEGSDRPVGDRDSCQTPVPHPLRRINVRGGRGRPQQVGPSEPERGTPGAGPPPSERSRWSDRSLPGCRCP
jgi:hypothetical protein